MECEQKYYERPAFWRVPRSKTFDSPYRKKRVSFSEEVSLTDCINRISISVWCFRKVKTG